MLINRNTDYALRAVRALLDGEKRPLSEICEKEAIPQQFGYKIMKKLARAGYVSVLRGKEGGYRLGDIDGKSVYDLMLAMEKSMDISPCVSYGYVCEAHKEGNDSCKLNGELIALQSAIDDQLKSLILTEILA